jgi:hypothetical protein
MRAIWGFVFLVAVDAAACQFGGDRAGGSGAGGAGLPAGSGGDRPGPPHPGSGSGGTVGSLPDGATTCVPGVQGPLIADCGYPVASSLPLTSVTFNESEVLRAIQPAIESGMGIVRVFYNDEHALTLGVRSVDVKTTAGTTTTDYPVTPLTTDPGSATDPTTGTNELAGDNNGLDPSLRPMWPALFLTDITSDPQSRAGDWQHGGRPINPDAIFGSWKAAVRTVDRTKSPATVTITPDADPAKNNWTLPGGDAVPTGLANEGFGAEMRWNVPLAAGHSYRLQVIVHDGDQNKAGGDSGEACVVFCAGGGGGYGGSSGAGGSPPPPPCPSGLVSCVGDIDPGSCPAQTTCVAGCCLNIIP